MYLEFEEYRIVTDDNQFIVQAKKVSQKNKNIIWINKAYCSSLHTAITFLNKRILLENHDLRVIMQKLNSLESKIMELTGMLKKEENN